MSELKNMNIDPDYLHDVAGETSNNSETVDDYYNNIVATVNFVTAKESWDGLDRDAFLESANEFIKLATDNLDRLRALGPTLHNISTAHTDVEADILNSIKGA